MRADPLSFITGFLSGSAALAVIRFLASSPRTRPGRAVAYIRTTVTCGCGHEQTTRIPYQPGMSEYAVTCPGCSETTWMELRADVSGFAEQG